MNDSHLRSTVPWASLALAAALGAATPAQAMVCSGTVSIASVRNPATGEMELWYRGAGGRLCERVRKPGA